MARETKTAGVAIVTGAAGGMGRPSAARLAAQGWPLILCDLDRHQLEAASASFPVGGPGCELIAGDLSDPVCFARLIETLGERPVGALIHAAGVSPTMGDARRMFTINYETTVRLVDAVRPRMAEGACAVLIASTSGYLMKSAVTDAILDALTPGQDMGEILAFAPDAGRAYALAKRAIIRFVARQATAFGARRARIVSISPGLIDTGMGRAEFAAAANADGMLARTPLGRLGLGDEIASVAVFLCSKDAAYISGCDILVDGGMLAAMGALA